MYLHFHWLQASTLHITEPDLFELCKLVNVPLRLFNSFTRKSGVTIYQYSVPGSSAEDSIYISIPESEDAYGIVTLKGSFFDSYPEFPVHLFRDFIHRKAGNFLRVDLSFDDDVGCLDYTEYMQMSLAANYKSYITGSVITNRKKKRSETPDSNNRCGIPDLHTNHQLIHYGNASGNYAKLYVNAKQQAKVELTIQDKKQNNILLDLYSPESIETFIDAAKGALVKHLNFCTPASIRAKRPKQIDSWSEFLGSTPRPIRWTDYTPANVEGLNIDKANVELFESGLSRAIAQLQNFSRKHDFYADVVKDIAEIESRFKEAFLNANQLITF